MTNELPSPAFKSQSHLQLSKWGYLLGAVLVLVGTLLLPMSGDPSDIQAMQQTYGANPQRLQASALLIVFGFWASVAGYSGLQQSMIEDGAAWARIGLLFHIIGIAVWTVGMSLDISYPAAIVKWLAASPEEVANARSVVTVLSPDGFGRGLFPMNMMINWLAFACLGIGLIRGRIFPAWSGWYGLTVGCGGFILGIAMTFTGREALAGIFIALMAFTIIWWIILSILISRHIYSSRQLETR